MYLYAAFARQIVGNPHVMVAREKDYTNAPVAHLCQLAQHAHKTLGHHSFVFEPEIEYVAHQKYRLCIVLYFREPRHETLLYGVRCRRIACTQMYVRCEIIHVAKLFQY